jgi:DNA-binding transcriptional regulator LsrR (DeoR family)
MYILDAGISSKAGDFVAKIDELRLIARVARMYYEKEMSQSKIARHLGLSQATVSRALSRARNEGIVRTTINVPNGIYTELEEQLIERFGLRDAVIVDSMRNDDEQLVMRELGGAAAYYVESAIQQNEIIGLSSWSSTLLALVDAMHSVPRKSGIKVVQILGGVGNPAAEAHANRLTGRMAKLVGGEVVPLPAPGIVGSVAARQAFLEDKYVCQATNLFEQVSMALVGIGAVEPSKLLAESGNIFSADELDTLAEKGAVGDILLRFFDANGTLVDTFLNDRVMSMSLDQLSKVDKAIGVAGGQRKCDAIRGALIGRWINILITDQFTAECLLHDR